MKAFLRALLAYAPYLQHTVTLLSRVSEPWAYVLLIVLAPVTEELTPVVGGFMAEQGHVGFVRAVIACTVGMWAGSMGLYALGRFHSKWVRLVVRRSSRHVKRLMRSMRSNPWRSSILARVAFGARIAFALACGAAHVDSVIFAAGTAIGALAWSLAFCAFGWFFGESAVLLLGHARRYEDRILALLVVLGLLVFLVVRRREQRVESVATPTPPTTPGLP